MLDITLFSFILGFLSLVLFLILYKNRNLPPGPYGLPLLGYYPFLDSQPYITIANLAKYYKSDLISFRTVGGHLIFVLNGLPLIKEVFASRSDEFNGRPLQTNIIQWQDDGLGIAQEEGEIWKEQRRYFLHTMKNFGFGKVELEGKIHEEIKLALNDIRELQGKPFNPKDYVTIPAANVIYHILCNKSFKRDDEHFQNVCLWFSNILRLFTGRQAFLIGLPFKLLLLFTKKGREAITAKRCLHKAVTKLVDNEVITFDSQHIRHFVDAYWDHMIKVGEKGELQGSSFTRRRFIATALNILLDGIESVGATMNTFVTLLGKYPEAQRKAQEEIDSVIGTERLITWKDKQDLPYVDAFLLELYRHGQPFLISTLYSNFEETTLRGYRIPKRSVIFANFWSINFDPKLFENPEAFDPDRFLDQDGKRIKKTGPFPFGIGKRNCVGESLAQVLVFLFIATLLQNFTVETLSDDTIRASPRDKQK